MIPVKDITAHFKKLYDGKAIYVWGMNCELITPESIEKAIKQHSSSTYPRSYYIAKLEEGLNHIGADCSGSFYPVSGFDTTAQGYYNRCIDKGPVKDIPNKPCMVFIKGKTKIDHIGWYDGFGSVYEMKNSRENCKHDKLSARSWTYYGIPAFADYTDWEANKAMIELDILRKGSKGEQVKTAQRLLKALGYSVGLSGIDGDFGKKTEEAVKKFQSKERLTTDGVIGQKTWEALLK